MSESLLRGPNKSGSDIHVDRVHDSRSLIDGNWGRRKELLHMNKPLIHPTSKVVGRPCSFVAYMSISIGFKLDEVNLVSSRSIPI